MKSHARSVQGVTNIASASMLIAEIADKRKNLPLLVFKLNEFRERGAA